LDYRTRLQQERRKRQVLFLALIPAVIVGATLVGILLRALTASAVAWTYEGPKDNFAIPAVSGNVIVAVFSEGQVHCLRVLDGSQTWPTAFYCSQRLLNAAAIVGDTAVICSDYGKVYGLDISNGERRWSRELTGLLRGSLAVTGTLAYVATRAGKVYELDTQTGRHRLLADTQVPFCAGPALCGDLLVAAGFDGAIVAIEIPAGNLRWRKRADATFVAPVAQVGQLVAIGSDQGRMYVFDPQTGSIIYTFEAAGLIRTAAVGLDDTMFFCDSDGWLYSCDAATGASRFRRRIGDSLQAGPIVYHDALYCLVDGDRVVELDHQGSVRRSWRGYQGACHLALGSGYIVVGTHTGRLYGIEP
jgi:eukaryotic-like serine/threonine-protein kinase